MIFLVVSLRRVAPNTSEQRSRSGLCKRVIRRAATETEGLVYIYVCMSRIVWWNWTVSKSDFWCIGPKSPPPTSWGFRLIFLTPRQVMTSFTVFGKCEKSHKTLLLTHTLIDWKIWTLIQVVFLGCRYTLLFVLGLYLKLTANSKIHLVWVWVGP